MKPDELKQLRISLINQGYSRRYARRLAEELDDHGRCVANESLPEGSTIEDSGRIGSVAGIAAAVHQRPELRPLPHRRPLTIFIVLPVFILFLFSLATLQAFQFVAESHFSGPDTAQLALVAGTQQTAAWASLWMACLAGFMAAQARVSLLFPAATGIAVSAIAAYQIDIGFCALSQSMVCFPHWQLDSRQIGLTAAALCLGFAASRLGDWMAMCGPDFSRTLERAKS